jgi:hypothetical protein
MIRSFFAKDSRADTSAKRALDRVPEGSLSKRVKAEEAQELLPG